MDLTHPAPADDGASARPEATGIRALIQRFAPKFQKLWRYAAVSCIATGTSLTILGVLTQTRTMPPGWANVVATCIGTIPSFELNRRWVWAKGGRRHLGKEIIPYASITGAGLVLSTIAVSLTGHWADHAGLATTTRTIAVEGANLTAFGILWLIQFAILDRVLFRNNGTGDDDIDGGDPQGSAPVATTRATPAASTTAPRTALERVVV